MNVKFEFLFRPSGSDSAPLSLPLRPVGYYSAPGGVWAGVPRQHRLSGSSTHSLGPVVPELTQHVCLPQILAGQ